MVQVAQFQGQCLDGVVADIEAGQRAHLVERGRHHVQPIVPNL